MPFICGRKYPFKTHIFQVYIFLAFYYFIIRVNPDSVSKQSVLVIFAVAVKNIALELQTQKADDTNILSIICFWICNQLSHCDILLRVCTNRHT